MKTTKAFEQAVHDFIQRASALQKGLLSKGVDTNGGEWRIPTREDLISDIPDLAFPDGDYVHAWAVTDNHDLPFACKMYIDPVTKERSLAADGESVVEWAAGFNDPIYTSALNPAAFERHVVLHNPAVQSPSAYLAVCNDGCGHVSKKEVFPDGQWDSLQIACGYAYGLLPGDIRAALGLSYGDFHREEDTVYAQSTEQGFIYKSYLAFWARTSDVCYIPEYGFSDPEDWISPGVYRLSKCDGYTYAEFVEACGGDEKIAEHVFDMVDWQSPGSYYDEMEPEDFAALKGMDDPYSLSSEATDMADAKSRLDATPPARASHTHSL